MLMLVLKNYPSAFFLAALAASVGVSATEARFNIGVAVGVNSLLRYQTPMTEIQRLPIEPAAAISISWGNNRLAGVRLLAEYQYLVTSDGRARIATNTYTGSLLLTLNTGKRAPFPWNSIWNSFGFGVTLGTNGYQSVSGLSPLGGVLIGGIFSIRTKAKKNRAGEVYPLFFEGNVKALTGIYIGQPWVYVASLLAGWDF